MGVREQGAPPCMLTGRQTLRSLFWDIEIMLWFFFGFSGKWRLWFLGNPGNLFGCLASTFFGLRGYEPASTPGAPQGKRCGTGRSEFQGPFKAPTFSSLKKTMGEQPGKTWENNDFSMWTLPFHALIFFSHFPYVRVPWSTQEKNGPMGYGSSLWRNLGISKWPVQFPFSMVVWPSSSILQWVNANLPSGKLPVVPHKAVAEVSE